MPCAQAQRLIEIGDRCPVVALLEVSLPAVKPPVRTARVPVNGAREIANGAIKLAFSCEGSCANAIV
jgi:hypothetical protein